MARYKTYQMATASHRRAQKILKRLPDSMKFQVDILSVEPQFNCLSKKTKRRSICSKWVVRAVISKIRDEPIEFFAFGRSPPYEQFATQISVFAP